MRRTEQRKLLHFCPLSEKNEHVLNWSNRYFA
jgi:hypothetical protein